MRRDEITYIVGEEKRANIRDWRTPSDLEGQDKNCLKEH
jgi:hypothetical protein